LSLVATHTKHFRSTVLYYGRRIELSTGKNLLKVMLFCKFSAFLISYCFFVHFRTNCGTLAAEVNCTVAQRGIAFCLLKIGKQTAVIYYVRCGLVVVYGSEVPESFFSSQNRVRDTSPSSQRRVIVIQIFFDASQRQVKTWSRRVRAKLQELTSHFKSLICKLVSMSSQMKFHIYSMTSFCYEMVLNML